ncbi:MAG: hypothetical protein IKU66_04800 [Clostridia bacterium]|nr:hypothetical protein [Clostridia bacterium]
MKKMSKGKKIAIIIISVILSLVIVLPAGLFVFFFRITPIFMDGEKIKAEYIDNPAMSVSWQEYDKQNLVLSGKTTTHIKDSFEITLPENFVFNEDASGDRSYAYWIINGEEASAIVTISEPIFSPENSEYDEEIKDYETMQLVQKILYGHASKKGYGIELGTEYDYNLLVNSINASTFDTNNHHQVFVVSQAGMMKSFGATPLLSSKSIYKVDTDTYKGFIYDRSKVRDDGSISKWYSMDAYAPDNLNFAYTIYISDIDNILTEDDIFAIFNSFKVK